MMKVDEQIGCYGKKTLAAIPLRKRGDAIPGRPIKRRVNKVENLTGQDGKKSLAAVP